MSNTVTNISYANTFGDWMVATNALINENNVLAAGDYTKSSGTIYLNETTQNSLQANGTVVIQKELRVQGTGSAATIDRNLSVGGQVLFSNTSLSVTTSGQANLNGLVLVQGPDIGISVSNNAYVGGNTTIRYNTITNNVQSNARVNTQTLSVTTNSYSDNLIANTQVQTSILSVSGQSYLTGNVYTYNDVNVGDSLIVRTGATVAGVNVIPFVTASFVQANAAYDSQNTTGSYANSAFLKANAAYAQANSASLYANGAFVQANSAYAQANSASLYANGAFVQANSVYTLANNILSGAQSVATLTVTGSTVTGLSAKATFSSIETIGGLSVGGNFTINGTTVYNSPTLVLSTETPNQIVYLGSYRTNNALQLANSVIANAYIRYNESNKNWEINDVLNTDTATTYSRLLSANSISDDSTSTSTSTTPTSRLVTGSYVQANASFLKANAAYGSQNTTGSYANSAYAQANGASLYANGASLYANGAFVQANAAFLTANTPSNVANSAALYANGAFVQANAAYTRANNSINANTGGTITGDLTITGNLFINGITTSVNTTTVTVTDSLIKLAKNNIVNDALDIGFYGIANTTGSSAPTYHGFARQAGSNNFLLFKGLTQDPSTTLPAGSLTAANAATIVANVAGYSITSNGVDLFLYTTNAYIQANTPSGVANSAALYANGAFIQANAAFALANNSYVANSAALYANGAFIQANSAFLQANGAFVQANAAYGSQNTTGTYANSAFLQANGSFTQANAAYGSQNTTGTYANSAFLQANGAFTQSNAAFLKSNSAYALANTFANTFIGTTGSISQSSGVISFSSNNGITVVATTSNNFAVSTSQDLRTTASPTFAGLTLTAPLAQSQGGTGATSSSGALTSLLPTGTTSGYVLTTGGPGSFYWAASSGGGGGATPGTTINSTRLSYTANGASGYTGNSFTTPTWTTSTQLRAYINGVRQFESEYSANSTANTITFSTAPTNGDAVLIEVDGYYVNPYYANNITYGPATGDIPTSANTIQLAIDSLESRKAALVGATFTGIASGITVATGVSNTAFATTAYVQNSIAPAFTQANTGVTNAATADSKAVTAGSYANGAFIAANTAVNNASGASLYANGAFIAANNSVQANSNTQFYSIGVGTAASSVSGEIRATSTITAGYSDDNLKTKLGTIENALDKVMCLTGFYYEPNQTAQDLGYVMKREVGVSAQEVEKVLPEVVVPAPIDNKYLTIQYEKMVPLLIEAIKELKLEIDALKGNKQ